MVRQTCGLCPSQTQHWETFGSAITRPSVLSLRSMTSPLHHSSWFAINNISVHASKLVRKAVDLIIGINILVGLLVGFFTSMVHCMSGNVFGCMVWCPSALTSLPGLESFPLGSNGLFYMVTPPPGFQWFGGVVPHSSVVLNSLVLIMFQISSVTASAHPQMHSHASWRPGNNC